VLGLLVIPDPGWPYRIVAQGASELATSNCRTDLVITYDTLAVTSWRSRSGRTTTPDGSPPTSG